MIIDTKHNVGDAGFYAMSTQDCWCATIIDIECNCSDKLIMIATNILHLGKRTVGFVVLNIVLNVLVK